MKLGLYRGVVVLSQGLICTKEHVILFGTFKVSLINREDVPTPGVAFMGIPLYGFYIE